MIRKVMHENGESCRFFPYLVPFGKDQVARYDCQIEKHQLKE